jgi:dTDP-4-dehydrorhamnose reductase
MGGIELWGGIECTVNRVREDYFDQIERSGHASRACDLERIAALGVKALRYPVLWERVSRRDSDEPDDPNSYDWSWTDERLARLRELGVRPVVGLVHHGSGPRHTSLVDPDFPSKLAAYARAVAERYPWVCDYTPVNEPLTTARFSGLYGHWYPHGRDDETFTRALVNQCRAVALSMRAVREINPAARLVQTEDLGKTYSTRALRYQADFENERRWLSLDLLCGRVGEDHPLWDYLRNSRVGEDDLAWLVENPCPPDILGINHYVTSERFLDERVERYPARTHGGNGRHAYADVEAVRVLAEGLAGHRRLLREAWDRYGLPLAVTEAHLGCTREEQMRWLKQAWDAARALREEGVDVRAVAAWAMLGVYDWDRVVTCSRGHYEPGVFDLRSPAPRPTALATMMRGLATEGDYQHPVLDAPGWWQRLDRLQYVPHQERPLKNLFRRREPDVSAGEALNVGDARPLLIAGASGTLGRAFADLCHVRGLPFHTATRREFDIADAASVEALMGRLKPWAVVNAAGYVRVDDAERERAACLRENADGAATLAESCARHGARLLTFSSDLVFDGAKRGPYVESDEARPLNVYGESKAEAERRVLASLPSALVVRTSAFFGPWDEYNFVTAALNSLAAGNPFVAASDYVVSPTYVPDLVHASLDLLIDDEQGVFHLANRGEITWASLARLAAERARLDPDLIEARPTDALRLAAPRPRYSALASERAAVMPTLEDALSRYFLTRRSAARRARLNTGAGAVSAR